MKLDAFSLEADPRAAARSARAAEDLGLERWCSGETNFNVLVTLAQAVAATERIGIGSAVAVAFARSPMELAYAANDLQLASGGRFCLGLGTQVAAHIERRFSMPWSDPVPRMREYLRALRAIWTAWEDGTPLTFEGHYYRHTLMTPFFAGPRHDHGPPPVGLAAVGPAMTTVAGELSDSFLAPPMAGPRYLREVSLPALARGAHAAGRAPGEIEVCGSVLVVAGHTAAERAACERAVRRQIGFYASTPAYRGLLESYGWQELGSELVAASRRQEFDRLGDLVDDAVLHEIAVVVDDPADLPDALAARYAGLLDRLSIYPLYRPDPGLLRRLTEQLRER